MSSCLFRIQFADGRVEERTFGDGRFAIGSDNGAIVLPDPRVSARHGELVIEAGRVSYTDLGSSTGSLDARGRRVTGSIVLLPGQSVELGSSALSFLRAASPAPSPSSTQPPLATAAAPLAVAAPSALAREPAPASLHGDYSHPDRAVRHSYPLALRSAGFGDAVRLLLQTSPFVLARLGILIGLTVAAIVYWVVLVGGFLFFSKATPLLGWIWLLGLIAIGGGLWRFGVRYFLYLLKAAHIAVLTELITKGRIGNGDESMFQYGKRIVTGRFGQVNVLFGLGVLISGVVGAFNRTLDWIAHLMPVPGLDSVMGVVRAVLRASTTYIDESIFSYNLAREDENVWRSSQDGLIYYAQNAKEVLKTGLWVVVLDHVLSALVWIVMLAPAFALGYLLPGKGTIAGLVFAVLFAANVRSAVLRPLFLTMVMVKFHYLIHEQPIDLVWDERLSRASGKFAELKREAEAWVNPGLRPRPAPAPQTA